MGLTKLKPGLSSTPGGREKPGSNSPEISDTSGVGFAKSFCLLLTFDAEAVSKSIGVGAEPTPLE